MKPLVLTVGLLAVSACAHHIRPQVTQFNGDSVTFATSQIHKRRWALAAATEEAQRICMQGHGKQAEHASTEKDPAQRRNYDLFLCLN
ncbi:hypothetical protein ACUXV3_12885 [Roseobacteraceae bacterium NS-SX3]